MGSALAVSLLLIVLAAAGVVLGWAAANETVLWGSIGASALAAIWLAVGYARSKSS